MSHSAEPLRWIESQEARLCDLVSRWARIGSGSHNLPGLAECAAAIVAEAGDLGGEITLESLPPEQRIDSAGNIASRPLGRVVRIIKRPKAPLQVLLCIHYDTVYGPDDAFRDVEAIGAGRLRGPGVADAKGGLVVLLTALGALERSAAADCIGWEVLLNPDEEIGSPGSAALLTEAASRHDLGLVFEPALEGGSLVSARKGSGNFTIIVRGRAAHAGRNPHEGRNAIHALADLVAAVAAFDGALPGVSTNVGIIEGGSATNVVPDLAIARFNVRVASAAEQQQVEQELSRAVARVAARDGIHVELHGGFHSPPKELSPANLRLLEQFADCGRTLGLTLNWRPTGGACDGNRLAAAGLPNVDSLGVRGGAIHSDQEFVVLDSLVERAQLSASFLIRLAEGQIAWESRGRQSSGDEESRQCF